MAIFSPSRRLRSVDLPTLGLPTMATKPDFTKTRSPIPSPERDSRRHPVELIREVGPCAPLPCAHSGDRPPPCRDGFSDHHRQIPQGCAPRVMVTFSSFVLALPPRAIFGTSSNPFTTSPKMVWPRLRCSVGTSV